MRIGKFCCPLMVLLAGAGGLGAQDVPLDPPPDFSQESIRARALETANAWATWNQTATGLEQRVYELPMKGARALVQNALGTYLDFVDARRAYSQAVSAYIDELRAMARPAGPIVTQSAVYQDQVLVLGVNLNLLQAKFDTMRDSPDWVAMRRLVRPERDEASRIQGIRRQQITADLSFGTPAPTPVMSPILYQDSERQIAIVLQEMWTRYYQTLIDRVEQRPGGPAPLEATRPSKGSVAPAQEDSSSPASQNPLVGVWAYVEGSQEFNGVAEPRHAMLEIWIENGELLGRYRAVLPDYSGDRLVDLRLTVSGASGAPALNLQSRDPATKAQIVVERPQPGGSELMLVRVAGAQSAIPRGRELLHRR